MIQPKLIIYFSLQLTEVTFCQLLYQRGWNKDTNKSLQGQVRMDIKSVGQIGDGCNFCTRAGLYCTLGQTYTTSVLGSFGCLPGRQR